MTLVRRIVSKAMAAPVLAQDSIGEPVQKSTSYDWRAVTDHAM